jgi:hypothetical protein
VFGSKHRAEKKAAEQAAREAHDRADLRQAVINLIALAEGQDTTDPDWSLVLRHGERLVSTVQGCRLFEPRRGAGHWEGRSAGVSVPVPDTRIRVRVGKTAGTFVQGAETPTVIDTGNASITTQRVVFQGDKYTREWDFSKLIGVVHYSDHPATAIQVSNRQKTSGIVYPGPSPEPLRLAMTVAIAIFQGEADETVKELRDELAKLDASVSAAASSPIDSDSKQANPAPPTTKPGHNRPPPPKPMWAADPSGRHQWRYWNGKTWTDYVGDNGQQSTDALDSHP